MTGQPAQAWRKFRFATVPRWAYVFLVLICTGIGLLPIFIIMAVVLLIRPAGLFGRA